MSNHERGTNGKEPGESMVNFGFPYADQTENDYDALEAARKSGRINVAAAGT